MIEQLNKEIILCPACNKEHESGLFCFHKTMIYKGQKIGVADYYHTCPERKEFVQTGRDIIETWKLERQIKKQVDQQQQAQQQAQQQFAQGPNIQWTFTGM